MNIPSLESSSKSLQKSLEKDATLDIAVIGTECEVSSLLEEVKNQFSKNFNIVGVYNNIDVTEADFQDEEDFLSEKRPFYNHFNGSDKFDRDLAVESPPEDGDEWLQTNGKENYGVEDVDFYCSLDDFEAFLSDRRVDFLIFSEAHNYSEEIYDYLEEKQEKGKNVLPFAEFFRGISNKEPLINFSNHSFLYDFDFPEANLPQKGWRRALDVGVSLFGITVLAPLWAIIAACIKLTSSGPIIYQQDRVGKDGEIFTLYKFRTMREDAEDEGPQWASEDDERVTKLGRFLRATKLDETPQFLNVLKGEMRLIGPRPERPEFVEKLRKKVPFYDHRHRVHPGLTGWAQIHYGYGSSVKDAMIKLQYDLYGIKHRSIGMDIKILWYTLLVVTGLKETKKVEVED